MKYAQQCIIRWVESRRFLRELREAAGDDDHQPGDRDSNASPLACLQMTEHGIDRLFEGLVQDRAAEQLFRMLVEGHQVCLDRFWLRFPATLLTWTRCCRWQKILGRVDIRKLDAGSQHMLRRINRDANAELAQRLDRLDPIRLASRIDGGTGMHHANIVAIYTVAYILRRNPSLWQAFRTRLADLKARRSDRPDIERRA